jgi:hypothetical protein
MNNFLVEEIDRIIKATPNNAATIELSSVIFCLGRDAENEEEYDDAFAKRLQAGATPRSTTPLAIPSDL